MNHIERMKMIDEFFDNLSIEEFENLAIDCGFNDIKPSSSFEMELVAVNLNNYSPEEKYTVKKPMQEFNPSSILVEAV